MRGVPIPAGRILLGVGEELFPGPNERCGATWRACCRLPRSAPARGHSWVREVRATALAGSGEACDPKDPPLAPRALRPAARRRRLRPTHRHAIDRPALK